jgi:ABC-type sugar transport system ATPase subunit
LLGKRRIKPTQSDGVFPFLHQQSDSPEDRIRDVVHVSFGKRNVISGGEFTDYTARYGAMRDQDGQTLLENLLESVSRDPSPLPPTQITRGPRLTEIKDFSLIGQRKEISRIAELLNLLPQLNVPMIALSNGQQRRARILRQLIKRPRILLLEDPFGETHQPSGSLLD